jgi:L-amino acid N-acyltransferase YncA
MLSIDEGIPADDVAEYAAAVMFSLLGPNEVDLGDDNRVKDACLLLAPCLSATYVVNRDQSGHINAIAGLRPDGNPWTGLEEGYIFVLHSASDSALGPLLQAVVGYAQGRGMRLLRAEVPDGARGLTRGMRRAGWMLGGLLPSFRIAGTTRTDRPVRTTIRFAEAEDQQFVLGLLVTAVLNAMSPWEQAHAQVDIRERVERYFAAEQAAGSLISLVAQRDGALLGHCTGRLSETLPYLTMIQAELIDTFVLFEYRGEGIGDTLTDSFVGTVARRGVELVHGTIDETRTPADRVARVRNGIESQGWFVNRRLLTFSA